MKLKNSILKKYPELESHSWSKADNNKYKCDECDYEIFESNGKLFSYDDSPVTVGSATITTQGTSGWLNLHDSFQLNNAFKATPFNAANVVGQPTADPYRPDSEKLLSCDDNNVKDVLE